MNGTYYRANLAADRLRRCYEIAPPRVQRHLVAELDFALSRLRTSDTVLELGCGYGRVMSELVKKASYVAGIDTARASLVLAAASTRGARPCAFLEMDATCLGFRDGSFDAVICIQNGICAFNVDQEQLVREAARVLRSGGRLLISTYAPAFWPERLRWFEEQAAAGLIGEIDVERTGNGTIICRDGFRSASLGREDLQRLCERSGLRCRVFEVDGSCLFCEAIVRQVNGR